MTANSMMSTSTYLTMAGHHARHRDTGHAALVYKFPGLQPHIGR
jgi:hypothetical protein